MTIYCERTGNIFEMNSMEQGISLILNRTLTRETTKFIYREQGRKREIFKREHAILWRDTLYLCFYHSSISFLGRLQDKYIDNLHR